MSGYAGSERLSSSVYAIHNLFYSCPFANHFLFKKRTLADVWRLIFFFILLTTDDVEAAPASSKAGVANESTIHESPSSTVTSQTPSTLSTPIDTPVRQLTPFQLSYHHNMKIYSADGTVDRSPSSPIVTVSAESTPTTSPMTLGVGGSRKKQRLVFRLFLTFFPIGNLRQAVLSFTRFGAALTVAHTPISYNTGTQVAQHCLLAHFTLWVCVY